MKLREGFSFESARRINTSSRCSKSTLPSSSFMANSTAYQPCLSPLELVAAKSSFGWSMHCSPASQSIPKKTTSHGLYCTPSVLVSPSTGVPEAVPHTCIFASREDSKLVKYPVLTARRAPASWNGVSSRLYFWTSVKIVAPQLDSASPKNVDKSGPTVVPAGKFSATPSMTRYLFLPLVPEPWIVHPLTAPVFQNGASLMSVTSIIWTTSLPTKLFESLAYNVIATCFKLIGGS